MKQVVVFCGVLFICLIACNPTQPQKDNGSKVAGKTEKVDSIQAEKDAKKNRHATDSIAEAIWIKK